MDAIGKELLGTVIAPPETVKPLKNVCKAVNVFAVAFSAFVVSRLDIFNCKAFKFVLKVFTADIGKELLGTDIAPNTVKPQLNVGIAFTVNVLAEFAPIVVSRVIDTDPPETVKPLENVCKAVHVFAIPN